jgi:hypothetical protein
MGKHLREEIRGWATGVVLAALVAVLCWFMAPIWRVWNATGFDLERGESRLRITNARTTALESLCVSVSGAIPSQVSAAIEGEGMAEVSPADPIIHRFSKMADGSDATLGRGAALQLDARSHFNFRRDVRALVLIAKDGFFTNLENIEAVRPLKWLVCSSIGLLALCAFAPRARRRLRPTSLEKTIAMAEGTAAQKEEFQDAFRESTRLTLEQFVRLDTMSENDIQHVVYDATVRMLRDASSLRSAKGAQLKSEITAWIRRHTKAALDEAYAVRSAHGNPGWFLRYDP